MLKIYYRISNSEKPEFRPSYYSKEKCFQSLVRALENTNPDTYILEIIYDGEIPEQHFLKKTKYLIDNILLKSNSGSCWYTYEKSIRNDDNDIIYYVEDDYLHCSNAISELLEFFKNEKEVDYVTLYDHPVRYAKEYRSGLDLPTKVNKIWFSGNTHWRVQESTCMTFASRVKTLKEDKHFFEKYVKETSVPKDRELFRSIQGLDGYEENSNNHILVGPIPSLATHVHLPWLALGIDWENI